MNQQIKIKQKSLKLLSQRTRNRYNKKEITAFAKFRKVMIPVKCIDYVKLFLDMRLIILCV